MEEGEDIQELSERAREKKERRVQNKLLKEAETVDSPGPDLDTPRGGRKNKKGKGKIPAADFDVGTPASSSKRKRGGGKSTSMTPSLIDDDDDERDTVSLVVTRCSFVTDEYFAETSQDEAGAAGTYQGEDEESLERRS